MYIYDGCACMCMYPPVQASSPRDSATMTDIGSTDDLAPGGLAINQLLKIHFKMQAKGLISVQDCLNMTKDLLCSAPLTVGTFVDVDHISNNWSN